MNKVLFLHGKESGPHGPKYEALVRAGFDVIAPDMRGMDLCDRVPFATTFIMEHRPIIVGSSLGGITAIFAALNADVPLPGIVLCAPALHYGVELTPEARPLSTLGITETPVTIIHGINDDVIPVELSREYAAIHKCVLVEVDDDHRLNASIGQIVHEVAFLLYMFKTKAGLV